MSHTCLEYDIIQRSLAGTEREETDEDSEEVSNETVNVTRRCSPAVWLRYVVASDVRWNPRNVCPSTKTAHFHRFALGRGLTSVVFRIWRAGFRLRVVFAAGSSGKWRQATSRHRRRSGAASDWTPWPQTVPTTGRDWLRNNDLPDRSS